MIKTLDVFGGVGSPRVAFRNLGIDVKAVRSYNAIVC